MPNADMYFMYNDARVFFIQLEICTTSCWVAGKTDLDAKEKMLVGQRCEKYEKSK